MEHPIPSHTAQSAAFLLDHPSQDLRRRTPSTSPPAGDGPEFPEKEVIEHATEPARQGDRTAKVDPRPAVLSPEPDIHPYLTQPDLLVLENLFQDIHNNIRGKPGPADNQKPAPETIEALVNGTSISHDHDRTSIARLKALNNPVDEAFQPTVFTTWDAKDIPEPLNKYVVRPYARLAAQIVRHPTDVVFLTHLLLYFTVNLGSAIYLFYNFTYIHGVAHAVYTLWCAGSFTLMMHNHIHNGGVLARERAWLDWGFPYVLEPLMGHTWDSYYYHHVKHHHVEGNGPNDLSTTIRYQRDSLPHFLHYIARFLLLIWAELPLYFYRKGKPNIAIRALLSELASYAFMASMTYLRPRAATFVLLIPFVQLRIGLMIGNWGQHALVDELEPDSDFRSSITLVDVPSNRFCFNDGYHTAHHLNPLRHWREQPVHFLQSKEAYRTGRALVFHNIDYLMLTVTLLRKDYMHLASCLVPMGDQIGMTRGEIAEMLRTKTRAFSEEEIRGKFGRG